jgi:hypothetical protein
MFLTEYERSRDYSHFKTSLGRPAGVLLGLIKPEFKIVDIFILKTNKVIIISNKFEI